MINKLSLINSFDSEGSNVTGSTRSKAINKIKIIKKTMYGSTVQLTLTYLLQHSSIFCCQEGMVGGER